MNLLIADDQYSIHRYLEGMVDWKGLEIEEVFHAYDGQETIDLINQKEPDILLIDIEMPKFDGIQVLEMSKDCFCSNTIILSAFDEFQYARDALRLGVKNYILKPIDVRLLEQEISDLVNDIKNKQKHNLEASLRDLLYFGPKENYLFSVIKELENLNIQQFTTIYLEITQQDSSNFSSILMEWLPSPAVTCQIKSFEYIVILPVKESDSSILEKAINLLSAAELENKDSFSYWGGISPVEKDRKDILLSIKKSKQAAQLGFYKCNQFYYYTEELFRSDIDNDYGEALLEEIRNSIELGYLQKEIIAKIRHMFSRAAKRQIEPTHLYDFSFQVVQAVKQVNPQLFRKFDSKELTMTKFQEKKTVMELETFLLALVQDIRETITFKSRNKSEHFERIRLYVENHYWEDVSLTTIAEKFYIDKFQLSRLFKRYYSQSYWSYVTQLRMEKAKELLLHTNNKVNEIAEKVGFPDESHFSSNFKKYYGLSPKKFKEGKYKK